jgi:hypothetical protein
MNLSPRLKKILIIIGFIILVVVLAWLIYFFFFRSATPTPITGTTTSGGSLSGGLPTVSEGDSGVVTGATESTNNQLPVIGAQTGYVKDVTTVATGNILGLATNSQGGLVYYNSDDSKFYQYSNNQLSTLSDKSFYDVEAVTWSGDGASAILEYPDGYNIFYNFNTGEQVSLPKEMEDFSFDGWGDKIAAKIVTGYEESNWIVTANYDGSGISFVEHLGNKSFDVDVDWSPAGEIVATYREGIDFERQEVYPIGQSGGNIKSLTTAGRGFESQWSPAGDYILYSVYNSDSGYRPTLWLADMGGDWTGSYNVSLGLNTWSDKCVFTADSRYIYCAVPEDLPELSGIFPELADDLTDILYRLDVVTGDRALIALPDADGAGVNMQSLNLSSDGQILYFTDQISGELKSLILY